MMVTLDSCARLARSKPRLDWLAMEPKKAWGNHEAKRTHETSCSKEGSCDRCISDGTHRTYLHPDLSFERLMMGSAVRLRDTNVQDGRVQLRRSLDGLSQVQHDGGVRSAEERRDGREDREKAGYDPSFHRNATCNGNSDHIFAPSEQLLSL
jgi:hypothetical protein